MVVSNPSIFTLRANASRTRSSLLLATRRTKNCMFDRFLAPMGAITQALFMSRQTVRFAARG